MEEVSHPNLVGYYGVMADRGCLLYEFCNRGPLTVCIDDRQCKV